MTPTDTPITTTPTWRPGTNPALLTCPCELGPCGWCTNGNHDRCAWIRDTTPTIARKHKVAITNSKGRVLYLPGHGHAEVHVIGGHTWTCACHRDGHGPDYQPGPTPTKNPSSSTSSTSCELCQKKR